MIVMWATVLVGLARTNVEGKTLGRVTVMTVGAGKHEPTKTTGKPNVARETLIYSGLKLEH
jgi:hypothetical protein